MSSPTESDDREAMANESVAATMAEKHISLPEALKIHGVELTATQLRALKRNVAFKEIDLRERFDREARTIASLNHPREASILQLPWRINYIKVVSSS